MGHAKLPTGGEKLVAYVLSNLNTATVSHCASSIIALSAMVPPSDNRLQRIVQHYREISSTANKQGRYKIASILESIGYTDPGLIEQLYTM